jgi:hypothetical protein
MLKTKNYVGEKSDLEMALEKVNKKAKVLMYVSIGLGVALVGTIAFFLMRE